jgi:hypothetical protein
MMKMKNINKIFKSIIALILISSCSLDVELYDKIGEENFPENQGQLESIIVGTYAPQTNLLDDWGWWMYMQEVSSDVLVFPQRGTDWEDGGKWRVLHRHTWNSTTAGVQSMWNTLFYGINTTRKALLYFTSESPEAELARAELRVLRSLYYYLLIDNYGDVPYAETVAEASENPTPFRNKRGDIAERLIKVIEEELPKLPLAANTTKTRLSQEVAYMLLGKLYLNKHIYNGSSTPSTADMDKVADYMNMVIKSNYSLDKDRLAPFAIGNINSPENIYVVVSNETGSDGLRHNFRTLHTLHQQTFDLAATPWNGCAVKPSFYQDLFAANDGYDNADDLSSANNETVDARAKAFLHGQQYDIDGNELMNDNGKFILKLDIKADVMSDGVDGGAETRFSGYRVVKYEVEIGGQPIMNNNFPMFRLADAYLMRAEASLRGATKSDASADSDLNTIRNAAGLPNATASLDEVLDERGRELFMEGHRRQDLIRFGKFAARLWWLGADESDAGDHRLVFTLPQDELDTNPNLSAPPVDLNY